MLSAAGLAELMKIFTDCKMSKESIGENSKPLDTHKHTPSCLLWHLHELVGVFVLRE